MARDQSRNFSNLSNLTPKFPTIRYNHFGAKQKVHVIHRRIKSINTTLPHTHNFLKLFLINAHLEEPFLEIVLGLSP